MAKLTPYAWQTRDQDTLRAGNWTGLVAIEAGGGKSLTATLALKEVRPSVTLIVAPQSTHRTAWIPTLRDNAGIEARIVGNTGNKHVTAKEAQAALADLRLGFPGTYLVTPQFLTRTDTDDWAGDFLIVDESHQVTTMGSKAQRKLSGYTPTESRKALARRFTHRLALSGTPMRQSFQNMWGTMRLLWPDLNERGQVAYDNPFSWQSDRMQMTEVYTNQRDQFGNSKKVKQFHGEKVPGLLLSQMPTVIMHKRRETCCADPSHRGGFLSVEEPQVIKRYVDLTPKQVKGIREMETHMLTYLKDNPLVADIPLTQKQRIRQMTLAEADAVVTDEDKTTIRFDPECKSPFLDEVQHILSNLPDDEPVVLYMESRQFAAVTTERLNKAGIPAAEYSGVTKADLTRFGKDYRVLVGVISAIGTGTAGLNHVSNTEIIIEQPVSLTMKVQSEARLERLDNRKRVQRYILMDSYGVQEDRFNDNILKQMLVNKSLRRVA